MDYEKERKIFLEQIGKHIGNIADAIKENMESVSAENQFLSDANIPNIKGDGKYTKDDFLRDMTQ